MSTLVPLLIVVLCGVCTAGPLELPLASVRAPGIMTAADLSKFYG